MHRAGLCSIFSQLAREGRLSVVEDIILEAPKTKLLAEKFKTMGLDSVLIITDTVDENLYLASRNLPHVAIVEPRYADPLADLLQESAGHEGCGRPDRGVAVMSEIRKNDHRLMQVLLAPVISEKATLVADKNEQVVFEVAPDATKQEVKAAVELLFKVEVDSVNVLVQKGKQKRFGRSMGRRKDVKKAYVCLKPGQEINFEAEAK